MTQLHGNYEVHPEAASAATAAIGEQMAAALLENANGYLNGERDYFYAHFGLVNEPHLVAATRFSHLLRQSSFGDEVHLGTAHLPWHDDHNQRLHRYVTDHFKVAEQSGRVIFAALSFELDEAGIAGNVTDVQYSSMPPKLED